MSSRILAGLCAGLVFCSCLSGPVFAQRPGAGIVSQATAVRHGMWRNWLTQIRMNRQIDRVEHVVLDADALFVQTKLGVVHALDAESGRTLWAQQFGRRDFPNEKIAVGVTHLAIINGSTMYVVQRDTGQVTWQRALDLIPTGGPAVSKNWVYSPSLTGQCEALNIEEPAVNKWNYSSLGRIDIAPLVTRDGLVWGTSRGMIYFCAQDRANIRFRLDARDAIAAPLQYWPPLVIAASHDGYVYAVDEQSGQRAWSFSTNTPIDEPPVAVEGRVYVIPDIGGMYCLSADTGEEQWFSPRVWQFLAQSEKHVYARDRLGRTLILDAASGGRLGTIPTEDLTLRLTNTQNDRLYLGTHTGLMLCLREADQVVPLKHEWPPEPGTETKTIQNPDQGQPEPEPPAPAAPGANPFFNN